MKGLAHSFLEILGETINALSREANPTLFNPVAAVLSALILTGTASFSAGIKLPALVLAISVALALYARIPIRTWARTVLIVAAWALVVSIPLPFITPGEAIASLPVGPVRLMVSGEGVATMTAFTSRATAAAAIFTVFASIMGWRRMMKGLEGLRVPREVTTLLSLSIVYVPLFLREVSKMLSAREARVMRKSGLRGAWGVLATVVGDLILRGYERAWRLEKAIRARSFAALKSYSWSNPPSLWGAKDLGLLSLTICIPALSLLIGL